MKKLIFPLSVLWINASLASLTSDVSDPFGSEYKSYKNISVSLLKEGSGGYPSFEMMKDVLIDALDPVIRDDFLTGLSFLYQLGAPRHPGNVVTDGFTCLYAKVLYAKDNGGESRSQWQELALLQLLAFHKSALEGLQKTFEEGSAQKALLTTYLSKMPTFPCQSCKKTALFQQFDIRV